MPRWFTHGKIAGGWRAEAGIEVESEDYGEWSEKLHPENASLIGIYSQLLIGQYAGMTDQLDLCATKMALEIAGALPQERPEMIERLLVLHRLVRDEQRKETK